MMKMLRLFVLIAGILLFWQALIGLGQLPPYILPTPLAVIQTFWQQRSMILHQGMITFTEAFLGLFLGCILGAFSAMLMGLFKTLRFWMLPILLISQALPTFAIAPLLVVWLGYGMASKVVVITLMLFFPIMTSLYDALRHVNPYWIDLARVMGANRWRLLWHIKLPAALPSFASGVRVSTAFAPLGAIVGEWVGSSAGLGYMLLNANARMEMDVVFAYLLAIIFMALLLYSLVDFILKINITWQKVN